MSCIAMGIAAVVVGYQLASFLFQLGSDSWGNWSGTPSPHHYQFESLLAGSLEW